jgi:hypothetical protein
MSLTQPDLGKVVQKDTNQRSSLTAQTLVVVRDTPITISSKSLFENNFQSTNTKVLNLKTTCKAHNTAQLPIGNMSSICADSPTALAPSSSLLKTTCKDQNINQFYIENNLQS